MSTDSTMQEYEIMLLFTPDLGESEVKKEVEAVKSEISEAGGKVTFEDFWGKKRLAYSIRGHEHGTYQVLIFTASGKFVRELEKELRLKKSVLRHLITLTPTDYQPVTAGEVEISETRYFEEWRAKKAGKRKAVPQKKDEPAKVRTEADEEKDSEETQEEHDKKLDAILKDVL